MGIVTVDAGEIGLQRYISNRGEANHVPVGEHRVTGKCCLRAVDGKGVSRDGIYPPYL